MPTHTVMPGDCLCSVAKERGFYNYLTIYKHADNTTRWLNPNMLEEGGTLQVPDKVAKKLPMSLDKDTTFLIDRQKTMFRVWLVDVERKKPKVDSCSLTVGSAKTSKVGANGLLEMEIDPADKSGILRVVLPALSEPDTGKKGPSVLAKLAGAKTPAHPPAIVAREFEDELDVGDGMPLELEITLNVGSLEPHSAVRGGLQRLNNLGCKLPDPTAKTATDDPTKAVIKGYQKLKGDKAPSGSIHGLLSNLQADHDDA